MVSACHMITENSSWYFKVYCFQLIFPWNFLLIQVGPFSSCYGHVICWYKQFFAYLLWMLVRSVYMPWERFLELCNQTAGILFLGHCFLISYFLVNNVYVRAAITMEPYSTEISRALWYSQGKGGTSIWGKKFNDEVTQKILSLHIFSFAFLFVNFVNDSWSICYLFMSEWNLLCLVLPKMKKLTYLLDRLIPHSHNILAELETEAFV